MIKSLIASIVVSCLCASAYAVSYHSVKISELDYGANAEEAQKAFGHSAHLIHERPLLGVRCLVESHMAATNGENPPSRTG